MKFAAALAPVSATKLKQFAVRVTDSLLIDPRLIKREPGFNKRLPLELAANVRKLKPDILANGVQEALTIRKDGDTIYLVNGDSRLTSVEELMKEGKWPEDSKNPGYPMPVPCKPEGKNLSPVDRLFLQLSLNNSKEFGPFEKGMVYKAIQADSKAATGKAISGAEIARRSGETKQAVSNALRLVNGASEVLIAAIVAGTLADSTALEIVLTVAEDDHPAQDDMLARALAAAKEAGRSKILPKDIRPEKQEPAPATAETAAPKSLARSTEVPADDAEAPADNVVEMAPAKPDKVEAIGSFNLYSIPDAPDAAKEDGTYFETERLVLEDRPEKFPLLHLLAKPDPAGCFYGYRLGDVAKLPDPGDFLTANLHPCDAFPDLLELALKDHPRKAELLPGLKLSLEAALNRFYPASGDPEDSTILTYANAIGGPSQADPGAVERIKNAGSTERDGSGTGHGNDGKFQTVEDQARKLEKLLEELGDAGDAERLTTANMIANLLKNETSIASLKTHLKGGK